MTDRAQIGNVEIIAFVDIGPTTRPTNQVFPDVPSSEWDNYKNTLTDSGELPFQMGFFALRSNGQTIVVDTGLGKGPHEAMGGITGQALENLKKAGIRVEDVNSVLITHLHGDHVGWNVTWEGNSSKPTFPNAKYYVPQGDWDYFNQKDVLENSPHMKANVLPLQDAGVLEVIQDGFALTPEITTLGTPGHTPGHQSTLINSGNQKAIVTGDAFHAVAQLQETDWNVGFDVDKPTAAKTRGSLMKRLEDENFTIAAGHMVLGSNIGKIINVDGKRSWQVL